MAVHPPKCRTCGKEEWRHICGPKNSPKRASAGPDRRERPAPNSKAASSNGKTSDLGPENVGSTPTAAAKPKTDRKEYLKLKARERRARQKAEREAPEALTP